MPVSVEKRLFITEYDTRALAKRVGNLEQALVLHPPSAEHKNRNGNSTEMAQNA